LTITIPVRIRKEQKVNIKESTKEQILDRKRWLEQAIAAGNLVNKLPEELLECNGHLDQNHGGSFSLTLYGQDALKKAKMAGVQGLTAKMTSEGHWYSIGGEIRIEGTTVKVEVYQIDQPLGCTIEEYTETTTRFRAICTEELNATIH